MMIAVIVPKNLFGDWVYNIVNNQSNLELFIINKVKTPFFERLFFSLDKKLFKGAKNLIKTKNKYRCHYVNSIDEIQIGKANKFVLNFSNQILTNQENITCYNFFINENQNIFEQIVINTILKSYKKVVLKIESNKSEFTTSVRFDSISVSKNLDLTVDTFLAIIKNNLNDLKPINENQKPKDYRVGFKEVLKYYIRFYHKTIDFLFYSDQWLIAYDFNEEPLKEINLKKSIKIIPPKDRFWADPIVVFENNIYFVFIEELLYTNNKGHISVFEIHKDGKTTKPQKILERSYHMSYPFVFKFENNYYMIPETSHNGSIELYKAKKFPYQWEFQKTIFENIRASDTTLTQHNDKWWMFTSIKEFQNGTYDNVLSVFYTDDPIRGQWHRHKMNTIKNGIENSRQGGPFFKDSKNNLYRVSQNASNTYGFGFNLHKVTKLTQNLFEEENVYSYKRREARVIGVHTYNNVKGLIVFDVLKRIRK